MHTYIKIVCSLMHMEGKVWSDGTLSILLPESSCEYIPSLRSVALRNCLAKVYFWLFLA